MGVEGRAGLVGLLMAALAVWALPPAQAFTVGHADRIGHWDPAFAEAACREGNDTRCAPAPQAMAALGDGRVFYFQGVEDGGRTSESGPEGSTRLLELGAGAPRWSIPDTKLPPTLPCADIAQLADGRLLVVGGAAIDLAAPMDGGSTRSASSSWILDPASSSLRRAAPLRGDRRHSSLVTLSDGRLLAAGGSITSAPTGRTVAAVRTETFDPEAGSWTENYAGPASESGAARAAPALPHA